MKSHHASNDHPAFRFGVRDWDWLALVRVVDDTPPIWLLHREVALAVSTQMKDGEKRITTHASLLNKLRQWEDNFALNPAGRA